MWRPLNATETPLLSGSEPLLHQLFLEQAERQPDHPAVIAGDPLASSPMATCRQHVLHLAHHLRQRGVQPNQLVRRSALEPVGEPIVAVPSASSTCLEAAYVPVSDPTCPGPALGTCFARQPGHPPPTQPSLTRIWIWPVFLTLNPPPPHASPSLSPLTPHPHPSPLPSRHPTSAYVHSTPTALPAPPGRHDRPSQLV